MRKHKNEMIRFIESEYGTEVWYKNNNSTKWKKNHVPRWDENTTYIVNDEYATLRKESVDTGRPIQVYNQAFSEWQTPTFELEFVLPIKEYRLKPKEYEYPIYKKDKNQNCIVKFTDLTVGEVIDAGSNKTTKVGCTSNGWIEHTNTDVWEDYEYEELKYPIYKKNKSTGAIIKFTDKSKGVIVEGTKNSLNKGYTSNNWVEHTNTDVWEECDPEETVYYYQWGKRFRDGVISLSTYITDEFAEDHNYNISNGWKKIENSKITWED